MYQVKIPNRKFIFNTESKALSAVGLLRRYALKKKINFDIYVQGPWPYTNELTFEAYIKYN